LATRFLAAGQRCSISQFTVNKALQDSGGQPLRFGSVTEMQPEGWQPVTTWYMCPSVSSSSSISQWVNDTQNGIYQRVVQHYEQQLQQLTDRIRQLKASSAFLLPYGCCTLHALCPSTVEGRVHNRLLEMAFCVEGPVAVLEQYSSSKSSSSDLVLPSSKDFKSRLLYELVDKLEPPTQARITWMRVSLCSGQPMPCCLHHSTVTR
jgi:hypothetical protein